MYEKHANGVKISKCEWYEFGEKSSKFFFNLEKQHAFLNQVRTLLCSGKEQIKTKLIKNMNAFIITFLLKNRYF